MKTTKELARELGLLRKRYVPNSVNADKTKKLKLCTGQVFSYLVVIDFESTCWQDGKFRTQEIIEFPAVLCNTKTGEIESVFHYYVQPQEQPVLSDFCKQLTGITQSQVEDGIPLSLCLRKFCHWLTQIKQEKNITFEEGDGARATFVTWSDWDLGVCLLYEARRKQLTRPPEMNSWIDLRATYRKFYGRKPHGLNGALQDVGIEFQGREHSGVDDARNTARLAWRMMRDGCILNVTKNITGKNQEPRTLCETKATDTSKVLLQTKLSSSVTCKARSPKTKSGKNRGLQIRDTNISPDTDDKLRSSKNKRVSKGNTPQKCSPKSKTRRMSDSSNDMKTGKTTLTSEEKTRSTESKDQACSEERIDSTLKPKASNNNHGLLTTDPCLVAPSSKGNSFKTPSPEPSRSVKVFKNPTSVHQTTPNQSGSVLKTPTTSHIFKTPSPAQTTANIFKTPVQVSMNTMKTPSPGQVQSDVFKTPSPAQQSSRNTSNTSNTMRATPPMCKCGRRSKRRMVQSPGPNIGRFFFTCGVRTSQYDKNRGCDFFQWEVYSGAGNSSRHVSKTGSNQSVSKPFTPVLNMNFGSKMSQTKRQLGVRSGVPKTIR